MVTADRLAGTVATRWLRLRLRAVVVRAVARGSLAVREVRRPGVQVAGALLFGALAARSCFGHAAGLRVDVAVGLGLAATVPLAVARVAPRAALAVCVAANGAFVDVARLAWPKTAIVAWLVALALGPLWLPRRQAGTLLLVAEAAVSAAVFVPDRINATPWDATIAEGVAALAAWWVGESLRSRRDIRGQLMGTAQRLRALAEQDAVGRERARIARELHDVVAHHVSTIAVRAATLPYEIDDLSPAVRAALEEIADGARAALVDLRAVLGVLRSNDQDADGIPQPRLADARSLVERVQAAGTPVALRTHGAERPLAASVEVCGYRIIQEALTNAIRHAAGSRMYVDLSYGADDLTIRVRNDGAGRPAASATATATAMTSASAAASGEDTVAGSGYGLIGMRERVAMLGGTLAVGPLPSGGFEVLARLPCPALEAARRAAADCAVAAGSEQTSAVLSAAEGPDVPSWHDALRGERKEP